VTRTVGWFTSQYPLALETQGEGVAGALKGVKAALASLPGRGLGYGLLRDFHPDEPVRKALECLAATEISFNYLGQFEANLEPGSIDLVGEERGPERNLEETRTAIWEISAGITAGQLLIELEYNRCLHRKETVEQFAGRMREALNSLIEGEAGLLEQPSAANLIDFGWNQGDLDEMMKVIGDE